MFETIERFAEFPLYFNRHTTNNNNNNLLKTQIKYRIIKRNKSEALKGDSLQGLFPSLIENRQNETLTKNNIT